MVKVSTVTPFVVQARCTLMGDSAVAVNETKASATALGWTDPVGRALVEPAGVGDTSVWSLPLPNALTISRIATASAIAPKAPPTKSGFRKLGGLVPPGSMP